MSFKSFFVHLHSQDLSRRVFPSRERRLAIGATFHIAPVSSSDRLVAVRCTLCSPKDTFSKKAGRENALKADPIIINKRDVPGLIAELSKGNVCGYAFDHEGAYTYLYKYML